MHFREVLSIVERYLRTTIITHDPVRRFIRIDPHIMIVTVVIRNLTPCFTSINRTEETYVQHIQGVFTFCISKDLAEIPWPLCEVIHGTNSRPAFTTIL